MVYKANIPQPTDTLDVSQNDLLNNFIQLNTSFSVDHYAYDDITGDTGKHNVITSPKIVGAAHPTTSASECKIYAMEDLPAIGLLNYSKPPTLAPGLTVPTPITVKQSPQNQLSLGLSSTLNIIDLGALNFCVGIVYAENIATNLRMSWVPFFYNSTQTPKYTFSGGSSTTDFSFVQSGSILQLKSTIVAFNDVYWQIQFIRIG